MEGQTTLAGLQVKDNAFDSFILDILVDYGGNGLDIKDNEFAGDALIAEIWQGFDETGDIAGAVAPDSHDNSVKADPGDRVFDFGADNSVKQN